MNLTKKDIKELKFNYGNAIVEGLDSFPFRGDIIKTSYAKKILDNLKKENE